MARVSIIIPCFNQGHFIHEAIDSVFIQTFNDWEIIVVNDGSTDDLTTKVLNELNNPKIKVLHIQNSGLVTARNIGIEESKGEFILPLDADNKLAKNYLEETMVVFNSNSNVDIVYTDAIYFGIENGFWNQPELDVTEILKKNLIDACAIFKKNVWIKNSGYNINMIYGWEDWNFWLKSISNNFQFFHLKKHLFYYRKSTISMLSKIENNHNKRKYLEKTIIINNYVLYLQNFNKPLTLLREYDSLKSEKRSFEIWKNQIMKSYDYKIGNFLLRPIRFLKKLLIKL
jgi:glycosyltransferase involved in cell wall biosynthesis